MGLHELLENIPAEATAEISLARSIDFTRLPRHVAIIMDGNGRWARQRHKLRIDGHRAGAAAVREVVETAARTGIEVLTLYAFSVENWKRPRAEISALMALLKRYLTAELATFIRSNVRLRVLGRLTELAPDVQRGLEEAMASTRQCDGLTLNVALNYGGRTEIVDAVRGLLGAMHRDGRPPEAVDEAAIAARLYTAGQPDPDLLIRTSGELRVSNFLLWQIAYAEIWVSEVLWPDFRRPHFLEALRDYQARERRYGGLQTGN
jgi:undecaprenyl diphosphate synthase